MKFYHFLIQQTAAILGERKNKKASLFGADYKQAVLIKQGREQFKTLMKKGISVPVVFL